VCEPHTEPNEDYAEVGGCPLFKPKSRFVELPCEVGQTVYVPSGDEAYDWVDEYRVESIRFNEKGVCEICLELGLSWIDIEPSDIGTEVFLSREEAEKALKERENV
jgi:hypothetical protein